MLLLSNLTFFPILYELFIMAAGINQPLLMVLLFLWNYLFLMAALPRLSVLSENSNGHSPLCSHTDKTVHTLKYIQNKQKFITACKSCIQIPLPATVFKTCISFFFFLSIWKHALFLPCSFLPWDQIRKLFLISQNIKSKYQDNKPLIHKGSFLLLGSATE